MPTPRTLNLEGLEFRDVPAVAYALTDFTSVATRNHLLRFDTATPGVIQANIAVTGLPSSNDLVGIDFLQSTDHLYGVGFGPNGSAVPSVQLFLINPATGAATAIGPAQPFDGANSIIGASAFGVDIDPVAGVVRVVNNLASDGPGGNANNFRLDLTTGVLTIDPDLVFPNAGDAPEVAVSFTTGASPQQFGIVSGSDNLVTHSVAPGFATLATVGPLGVNTGTAAGLDFYGPDNKAVAILGPVPKLYTINRATGAATLVGTVGTGGTGVTDVAVAPLDPGAVTGSPDGKVQLYTPNSGTGQAALGASVTAFAGSTAVVRATVGDVNGDGTADVIAVTGPGTPIRVTVVSGADDATVLVAAFDPFGGGFTGGGFVSAADLDGDGKAEFIVTPDQGGGPRVSIFSLAAGATATTRANFFGIDDPGFRGGARTAVGDVNGDGKFDLAVAAGFLGGPRTALFDGNTLLGTPTRLIGDFFAFPGTDATTLRNGVFVAMSDVDGDGKDDLIFGGGPGGAPRVFILSGAKVSAGDVPGAQAAPIANFFVAGNSTDRGGVRVAQADLDGDLRGDVAVGSGEGSNARVRFYRGVNFSTTGEPAVFQDIEVFGGAPLAGGVYVG